MLSSQQRASQEFVQSVTGGKLYSPANPNQLTRTTTTAAPPPSRTVLRHIFIPAFSLLTDIHSDTQTYGGIMGLNLPFQQQQQKKKAAMEEKEEGMNLTA